MRERVVITGIGCISSFGIGTRAYADAILAGATGIRPIDTFDTSSCRSHKAALISDFDPAAFLPPMKLRRVDEAGRLAIACARLTLDDAGLAIAAEGHDEVGVALGTYTAGLDSTVAYLKGLVKDGAAGVPALLFSNTVSNAPASLCAIEFGLRGPNVTLNQREASSLAAIAFACAAIENGQASAMLTGGVDRVEETFFKVHDRFHALSPRRAGGEEAARPFDRRRNGCSLGEGGWTLLVERIGAAALRGARAYGEVLGSGAASASVAVNAWPAHPSDIARAMTAALEESGVAAADVSLVIAAANGSSDLDRVEGAAIRAVFGTRDVPVVSLKGAIGESGAGGAAAIAAGLLALKAGEVPPTAGWSERDPAIDVDVSRERRRVDGTLFLVNSIASGGAMYSSVVRVL
jgi:3-oxoacyl-[acyl-carrier-protein] synthase II